MLTNLGGKNMLRSKLFLLAAISLIAVQPLLASNVQVGTCKGKLKSYATISDALSAVPSASTIYVCAGTYPEQVTMTQAGNLIGVPDGTANQVVITVPSGGLLANVSSMFGESVAAQVSVEGAGPVNISNITVDGTGGDLGCNSNTWVAGIFYGSISSGTVNRVRASNQTDTACGVAIWAENSDASNQSVTIENSTVYNADAAGIFVGSGASPTLTVNVNNNVVNVGSESEGIDAQSVNGTVRGNDVMNAAAGIFDVAPALNVTGNTFLTNGYGIFLVSGGMANNNRVAESNVGVLLGADGATLSNNSIISSAGPAVEMGCYNASVSGNLINDAEIGIDQVPLSGIGQNAIANTGATTTSGCASALVAVHAIRGNSAAQWHTPATPFGTKR
jgi:hypothetical protein